jgi:hypothetical protein
MGFEVAPGHANPSGQMSLFQSMRTVVVDVVVVVVVTLGHEKLAI